MQTMEQQTRELQAALEAERVARQREDAARVSAYDATQILAGSLQAQPHADGSKAAFANLDDAFSAYYQASSDLYAARNTVKMLRPAALPGASTKPVIRKPRWTWYDHILSVKQGRSTPIPYNLESANRLFAMLVRGKLQGGRFQALDYNTSHDGWDVEPCRPEEQTVACFVSWCRAHTPERDTWPTALANNKMDRYRAAIANGGFHVEERGRGTKHHVLVVQPDLATQAVFAWEWPLQPTTA